MSAPGDRAAGAEVLVSRAFAERYWHDPTGGAAIGQRVRMSASDAESWRTIVGVVESVRDTSLAGAPVGQIYLPFRVLAPGDSDNGAAPPRVVNVVMRTPGDPAALAAEARRTIASLNATIPIYDVQSMSEILDRSMAQTTFVLGALSAAAAITLLLGAIGLYGVIAYTVSLRTRELGLRIALGAEPRRIHALVLREGMVLAGLGVATGIVVFLALGRLLRGLLFEIGPADPLTLAATVTALVLTGLAASWWPARRAARADPLETLRAD